MGRIRKAASILTLGALRGHGRHASAAKAQAKAAKAAKAEAEVADAKTKVATEQAAAIAGALKEDDAHRHADLEAVARKEAEAMPSAPGIDEGSRNQRGRHAS